ncbi:MAG TPA: type IV toxin-antitoxin system AbiEi family antitoxin [Acidimicrobiales bacterium]
MARTGNRVLKPGDFHETYANPWEEFARLTRTGVLAKLTHGYYLLVPEEKRGGYWTPEVEGVALGIAVADYGRDPVALMGPAAARVLGAIPRALATGTVAVPLQRPMVVTTTGEVQFVTRKVERLDTQRVTTDITTGWVTTPEQTVLDLADRPSLGGITPATAEEAIRTLAGRCDQQLVARLARAQRKIAAWQRYCWVLGLPPPAARRHVPTYGLRGVGDAADYGLEAKAA